MRGTKTGMCEQCGGATEYVVRGVVYRKDRLSSRPDKDERCEACGTATPDARSKGYVDVWIADSVGTH